MKTLPALYYFSRGKHDYQHVNIANTVLVNKGDNVWYLGYIQDIDGDNAFVDFDCTRIPPAWIHMRHLWRHMLLTTFRNENLCTDDPCFAPATSSLAVQCKRQLPQVHAALREGEDGPYIFRPVGLLAYTWAVNFSFAYIYAGCTEASHHDQYELVHRWQLVEELPVKQPPLSVTLGGRSFVKHVVSSKIINQIGSVDESIIRKILRETFRPNSNELFFPNMVPVYEDRVYARIHEGTITFLFLEMIPWSRTGGMTTPEPVSVVWTSSDHQKMSAAVIKCFTQQFNEKIPKPFFKGLWEDLWRSSAEEESLLHRLASNIFREMLVYMDVHSQTVARRVCAFWNVALKGFSDSFITIDFDNLRRKTASNRCHAGYYIAFLLHHKISSKTKVLALVHLEKDDMYFRIRLVSSEIRRKDIVLTAIAINNCRVFGDLDNAEMDFANDYAGNSVTTNEWGCGSPKHQTVYLSILLPVCRRLVLYNHVIDGPFRHCSCLEPWCQLCECRNNVSFLIPKIIFDCGTMTCCTPADFKKLRRRFLACLEPYLPPVEQCVKDNFRKLHAKWVTSRPYPVTGVWRVLKSLLRLQAITEATAADSFWDDLDLRNFDDLPVSNLSWQPISYMRVYGCWTSVRPDCGIVLFWKMLRVILASPFICVMFVKLISMCLTSS